MKKAEIVAYGVCIALLVWVAISTIEIWVRNVSETQKECTKANVWVLATTHTTDMKVTNCQGNWDDTYEVTVEDIEGNLWAYYDSEPKEIGDVLSITMSGDEIINATER